MNKTLEALTAVSFCLSVVTSYGQERTSPDTQSKELGKVSWYRDFDLATRLAKDQNKSVLILFQEVPGCSTCLGYGYSVLSNPLMVEAIENEFIPLAIFNNKGGKDKEILDRYNEPTWNNPVVRIVNEKGENIVSRVADDYSATGLFSAMEGALKTQGKSTPEYMKLLGEELTAQVNTVKEKYYKMYCFWSGEKHLGAAEGVLSTKSGFMSGHEVVKVEYDNQKINEEQLTSYARQASITPIMTTSSYRFSDKDHFFYLKQTNYKYLPLSELQKTKINSALGSGQTATNFLSPKQKAWFAQSSDPKTKKQELLGMDIANSWELRNSR